MLITRCWMPIFLQQASPHWHLHQSHHWRWNMRMYGGCDKALAPWLNAYTENELAYILKNFLLVTQPQFSTVDIKHGVEYCIPTSGLWLMPKHAIYSLISWPSLGASLLKWRNWELSVAPPAHGHHCSTGWRRKLQILGVHAAITGG